MKKERGHLISKVIPGSIAEEIGIMPGDRLLEINGQEIEDVLDYRYYINDDELTITVLSAQDNEEWDCDIEKDFDEDLGLEFAAGLMDDYKHCSNKCIFCFIDQMPPGMRETLYFKDDDARLSFLQGNYVTLTNMKQRDVERICFYKLSPINISIQTTNPELRCRMLNNRFAGEALKKIDAFCEAGITINGQVVLCKGFNDGEELDRTLRDIEKYIPSLKSISIVPVGLTRFREGLQHLEPFSRDEARKVVEQITGWQKYYKKKYGSNIVFASDEWFLTAELPIPEGDHYEGFPQIENGVGMIRSYVDDFEEAFQKDWSVHSGKMTFISGRLFSPVLTELSKKIMAKYPQIDMQVIPIRNDYFGELITVAGLVTGTDIINQLKDRDLGDYLVMPSSMLRAGESVLLDDLTVADLEKALQIKIRIVKSTGISLLEVLDDNYCPVSTREVPYEQADSSDSRTP